MAQVRDLGGRRSNQGGRRSRRGQRWGRLGEVRQREGEARVGRGGGSEKRVVGDMLHLVQLLGSHQDLFRITMRLLLRLFRRHRRLLNRQQRLLEMHCKLPWMN